MQCIKKYYYLCIACLFMVAPFGAWTQVTKKVAPIDFDPVTQKIKGWVDSGYYQGASLLVARYDQVVYEEYFGNYDTATVSYIASAGKWLAAATIAAVVDDGRLSWEDKVVKWLPQFTDIKGQATLRQLLAHTAGYPDYQPKGVRRDDYQTLEEAVQHIVTLPADTLPGVMFHYGGLAMQVAGRMAELASGKDWENLFQEKIARPLGMTRTHFTPVDTTPGHNPMIGGGARASLHDYARFLSMISTKGMFKGQRILSTHAIKELEADQVKGAMVRPGEYVEYTRATQRKDIYGLGLWREEVDAAGNPTLISSPSWAGAYPWIDKTTGVYGFFLTRITNHKPGFNSFYASPVLPLLVRDVLKDARHPEVIRGYVEVGDGRLFYEELGAGEPIIFIHGHSFDHYQWEPQFYEFAKKFRVIRYDVRGYGRSSMPAEFSASLHASDLLRLMDTLKISKAHLVGLSLGGFIATDFMTLYPHRLLSAILASGAIWEGTPGPAIPWAEQEIVKRRAEIEGYKRKGVFQNKLDWFNALTIRDGTVIEFIRRPVWDMIYKWDAWQPLHVEPRYLLGTSVVPMLKRQKVKVPVLVLTGAADVTGAHIILELLPAARTEIVANAGHVSNLENPAGFNQAVLRFIEKPKKLSSSNGAAESAVLRDSAGCFTSSAMDSTKRRVLLSLKF